MGWRSEGGREVSLSFSPRQLLLSKSVLVIRQAVSCCLVLVPRVLESPLSGISPGDLFVVFPSFDCFFSLGFFRVLTINVYHGGVFLSFPLVINTESDFGLDFLGFCSDGDRPSGTVHLLVTVNSSVSFFVWNECGLLFFWDCASACNCELFGKFLCLE